ncbi:MocR-like pyridoxine biosynthesis transcription factor PdxR [Jeotgalicoccus meleagridis]|uniref:HTH-type transcriptional regulatory protein GabR n=1 Tax=Jeotgalicoccus meleagridis TaxID=2759181 RepID=A0A6V7RAV1_9STAP|nr:PLP-dependent aminotransferase family protein [Jeotgalicoccus meleagridis]CAD2073892.1 HTH-type transcriptional regulatory protein GabR [Jeotgalicoccus meleagridis]
MFINLDKKSELSLYEQLYEDIKTKILQGVLESGSKLPSKRQLKADLNISMTTVENTYNLLIDENLIYAKEKSGYYVSTIDILKVKEKALQEIKVHDSVKSVLPLGQVDTSIVQNDVLKKISNQVFSDTSLLNSGNSSGEESLKDAIRDYLYVNRGVQCRIEQIFIGPSTEYLLEQVIYLLDYPKMTLEDPGYPIVKKVLDRLKIEYDLAEVKTDGVNVDMVKEFNNAVTHITPSHQFPSGVVMSLKNRIKLLNLVSEQNGYLIEDDYDSEFRYRGRPLSSLQGLDQNDRTIYMNTFSKSVFPSLRLAVMVLPPQLAEKYYQVGLSCNVSRQMQHIIAQFMDKGYLVRHINRVRKHYGERMHSIVSSLERKYSSIEISGHHTGMHFVLRVPDVDVRELAKKHRIITMSDYSQKINIVDTVLVGIGSRSEEEIIEIISKFLDEVDYKKD